MRTKLRFVSVATLLVSMWVALVDGVACVLGPERVPTVVFVAAALVGPVGLLVGLVRKRVEIG